MTADLFPALINPQTFVSDETTERFVLKWGMWAALKVCMDPNVKTVLDIGCGAGEHTRLMRHFGKEVFTNDWKTDCDYPGSIESIEFDRQFDAVLCSHVIEHQRNVGFFLDKLISLVKDGGLIAIAAPSHIQHNFVTGHLTVWSLYLLAYNLMQAGVDCSQAECLQDNESTIIVHKTMIDFTQVKEQAWSDKQKPANAGDALDEETTVPWHDDGDYIKSFMPRLRNPPPAQINWNGAFVFPLPQNTKDIEILSQKDPHKPITLRYEAIKAKAEAANAP